MKTLEETTCPACAMNTLLSPATWAVPCRWLDASRDVIPPLLLRIVLAYEFGEAGIEKYMGENWFAELSFPFPFNLLSADVNWGLATGFELFGAAALLLGGATRFFSAALMLITVVAIAAVHWPAEWHGLGELLQGYVITDHGHGNYKLPLLYLVMLTPLLFGGAGRCSADTWIFGKKTEIACVSETPAA